MLPIAIGSALLAAVSNATGSVMQRRSTGQPKSEQLFRRDFIAKTMAHRLWLMGMGFQILGSLLQALALYNGSLVVVEPLMTTDLIVMLLIIHYRFGAPAGWREWSGAIFICMGLSGLLLAASPHGGRLESSGWKWLLAVGLTLMILLAASIIMRRTRSARLRAGVGGVATGINFALAAALTKLVMNQLSGGVLIVLTSWELYVLIACALVSVVMIQSTYAAGPLTISQPALTTVAPATSVLIGIVLFGDILNHSVLALAAEACSAAGVAAGIVFLAGSRGMAKFRA